MQLRGIVMSTELLLVLTVVIILAFVAAYNLSSMAMSQSASTKGTLSLTDAHVWAVRSGGTCEELIVQVFVTNLGSKPAAIDEVVVEWPPATPGTPWATITIDVGDTVNPGESRTISGYAGGLAYDCGDYEDMVVVKIRYQVEGDTRLLEVAKPAALDTVEK